MHAVVQLTGCAERVCTGMKSSWMAVLLEHGTNPCVATEMNSDERTLASKYRRSGVVGCTAHAGQMNGMTVPPRNNISAYPYIKI